ncbi:MAG: hypothetical protein ABI759_27450 [Candidatus Solibacter sp.]
MPHRAHRFLVNLLLASSASGQMLTVDRPPQPAARPLGSGPGFIGDHFTLGAKGEVWGIDAIRVWIASPTVPGAYQKVALFGGIEVPPAQPGAPLEPECDCHSLTIIQTLPIPAGTPPAANGQVDFKQVRWSVPGGQQIQFGVMGVPRLATPGRPRTWSLQTTTAGGEHALKRFDAKGKLLGAWEGDPKDNGLAVQVWGHVTAALAIRSLRPAIEVALQGSATFDVKQADPASLRFGPKAVTPLASNLVDRGGQQELVLRFPAADAGIRPSDLIACLKGRMKNGVPFEACEGLAGVRGK